MWEVVLETLETHSGNIRQCHLPSLLGGHPLELKAELHVAQDRTPRVEAEILKDDRTVRPRAADHRTVHQHAALIRLNQTVDDPEQRGFAATARTDHRDELALRHREAHTIKNRNANDVVLLGLEKGLSNVFDGKLGTHRLSMSRR
jgi:hypothetical protein